MSPTLSLVKRHEPPELPAPLLRSASRFFMQLHAVDARWCGQLWQAAMATRTRTHEREDRQEKHVACVSYHSSPVNSLINHIMRKKMFKWIRNFLVNLPSQPISFIKKQKVSTIVPVLFLHIQYFSLGISYFQFSIIAFDLTNESFIFFQQL